MSDRPYPRSVAGLDHEAELLYEQAEAGRLVVVHARLARTLDKQSEKIEEHWSTPFTQDSAESMEATARALEVVGREMDRWHRLLYPKP